MTTQIVVKIDCWFSPTNQWWSN